MFDSHTAAPDAQLSRASENGHASAHPNGASIPPKPAKPNALQVLAENTPEELKALNRWGLWRYKWIEQKNKWDKPPLKCDGKPASTTTPDDWTEYNRAVATYTRGRYDGLGFVLQPGDGIGGLDLDGCRDPETAHIEPEALAIAHAVNSYAEISPSGTGIRIFFRAKLPGSGRRTAARWKRGTSKAEIEIYDKGRYLTFTGQHLEGTPRNVEARQEEIDALLAEYFPAPAPTERQRPTTPERLGDNQVLDRALNAKNGAKFGALWNGDISAHGDNHSSADMALCCHLAYWTRDAAQIERLWLESGLKRAKQERDDYRANTIARALEKITVFYDPTPRALRAPDPGKVAAEGYDDEGEEVGAGEADDERLTITMGYPLTDTGNGERFIAQHGRRVLFCGALGWLTWDAALGRWEQDENNGVYELGKRTARSIYAEASHAEDDNERKALATWAKASESLARRNAMLEIASKDGASIKAKTDAFDTNPWLFNVANGTIDLETGKMRPHDRRDLITKSAAVIYDPRADAPTFFRFLATVLDGDLETAEFLQRFMGYTLTGLTREQCFMILHGGGSNGKSTLLNVLRWLLGPYCKQTKPDTLMQKKFGEGIPNDVAMLRGARMVTAIETNEGRRFDEAKIKEMTGGDPVTARFFRKEFFEFTPEFKLYLATNHKPQIVGDDNGIWRRVRLVPFNVHFWNPDKPGESGPEHLRADKTLADKLREELPGILNWALLGCKEWLRDGLPEPKSVTDATANYRTESDPVETFLSEYCFRGDHCETPNALLYGEFEKWAKREDEEVFSNKAFTARMKLKGFENVRGTGGLRRWKGVALLATDAASQRYEGGR
jgi:putative DNA primase/helicase